MDLDEEFDKMYSDTGSAQKDADLDAEFEKAYGQEPSPVPAADDHSTPLPSKNGAEGEVVQMSHEKPGPRAVSTTGGNEEKVEPLSWEDGDGGEERLPDGERNQWGGNLRNDGRKVLFRRNKDGKVIGYSTTSSMLVRHDDGKFAVVPTVVGGKELSQEEAVKHYAETGEHWGMADDEESAQKMAQEVHDTHMKGNQAKWNDWLHEHWDEVSDDIKRDRGMAYEHKKRTAPDKTQKASAGVEYGRIALETAKGAGEGWVQGIGEGTQNVIHGGIDFVGSVLNSIGRGLGGKPTFRQVAGTDARTGKPTMWAVRRAPHKGETEDGKDERDAPRRWLDGIGDAIIDYAEGLKKRNDERFHASDEFFSNLAGDIMPIVSTGGLATPTLVANGYADNYDNLYKQARESGKSHEEADRIASTGGVINAAIMGVVAKGPLKTWVGNRFGQNVARALGKSVMDGEANSMSGIVRSGTKWLFKNTVKDVGVSTVESGLLFGGQAAFNEGASEYARGEDVDPMKITMAGYEGAKSGVAMSLAMGGVQLIGQRAQYRRDVEDAAWKRTKSPRGATFNAMWFNEGTADLLKAEKDGTLKNGKRFRDLKDRSGLPSDMTAKEAEAYAKTLRSLGFTEENLRFFRRDKENYKRLGLREGDVSGVPMPDNPDVTLPPEAGASELMARELRSRGIEPVKFTVPSEIGADGRPVPRFTKVNVKDNYGGVNGVFNIAIDENAKVAIIDNGDGTYTAYDSYRNSETADSIDEAIEKAQMLALIQQVQNSDRQVKERVIRTEAEKYGNWDTLYYPTMEDAADAIDGLIAANGGSWNGLTDTGFLRTPDKAGRDAFYVSDNRSGGKRHGVAFLILDNIKGVEDIPRILGHEHVGHGGPNAEFGGSGGAVKFAENVRAKEFDAFKKDVVAGARSEVRARDMEAVNRNLGEVFAHYAAANLDREPSKLDRLVSAVNSAARKLKLRKTYSSADVKTMMARWKTAGRGEGGIVEGRADVPERFEFFPVEERKTTTEVKDETGNVRDEAPAQPEQGAPEPAGGEAARPVEAQPQGGEAPRHGAVEAAKTGVAEAPTAMRTERDFLRVMHDNQKPVRVPVGEISLPDTQFKEGADPKTGVVKGQELKGEYFESAENAVVVYVRKDGTKELVTGRHRFDLAKRNGKNDILARVFREADGYTPEDMRNLDAISNIIDEKGTEHDYIRYFENAKPSRAAAEAAGFLSRSKGRLAFELYEGATEGTRAAIDWSGSGADGLISPEQAGIIAKAAPRDAHPRNGAVQRILVKKAQDGLRGDRLAIVARSLAEEAKRRKAPAADGETQLDLFTSEEDLALLALEEKRAAKRVEKANEYGRVASVLQTAMQKGGRLDLNKAYARELGIKNPKDRKQLADARQKALEKADYWRNAVRLDEADKAALDAELGIAPKENLELESVTGDQIAEENRKRAEKEEIERRKAAPLKGGAGEVGQSLMDLGGAEGEDLFNRTQRPEPVAEKSAEPARPVKGAQATASKAETAVFTGKDGTKEPIEGYVAPMEGDIAPKREVVVQHDTGGEINARQKILGTVKSIGGDRVTVGYRDPWGNEQADTFSRSEIVGVKPLPQTRENGPVSAPKGAEATTPPKSAKPAEGRKSVDAAVLKEGLTAETPAKPVAGGKMPKTLMVGGVPIENGFHKVTVEIEENGRTIRKSVTPEEAEAMGMVMYATLETKPAAPAPKAPKTPSVRMKDEAAERKAKAALDAIDFDTPELDGLKSKIRNGTILTEADQRQFAEDVRKGRLRYPRFRADEIAASTGKEHGKLWQYILSLESARMDGRRARGGSEVYGRAASQVRRGGSEWGRVGTGSAQSPSVAYSQKYRKLDSGTESEVFDTGDGWVVKVRQIHPLSIGDVIDELAKVVYHNYLFPGEKYVLDDIVRHEHDGYREFYLILRQPFVTPKTENGRIVQPTYAQIWQLMKSRPQGFTFMDLSSRPAETGEYGDYSSSDGDEGEIVPAVKKVAYNRQFVVYDFQPGRNTFIDAKSGKVRFIDPRIDINDPGAGFRYSKYGTRRKFDGEVDFDTPDFDPERFGKLVTGVGKLVDVLVESGHREFKALATYIYERDAAKYGRAKPVLRNVWNQIADLRGLDEVSRKDAERVFGIIEAQDKEAADENVRRGVRGEVLAGEPAAGGGGSVGLAAGQSAAGGGERQPGGVLAGGRVRTENPDARVDGKRPGELPGQHEGLADKGAPEGVRQGHAGNEAADGDDAVGDRGGSELGERASGRDRTEDGDQVGVSRVKKRADKAADATKPNPPRRDFVMTRSVEDAILEKNTAQRVRNNLDAIKLIRDLKARDYAATPEEQATLAKFVGWGGLREKVFGYALERAYDLERTGERDRAMSLLRRERVSQSAYDLHKELRSVLNDSEYESAKASASTAFYTPVDFVRVLHDALRNIGVKGGRFLGPSAGTGNFASAAGEYEKPVNWHFVEKDVLTGEMLKALFPNQRVTIGGFEETKFPDGFFDFAIDNVPYADVPISDRSLSSKMFKIHDYFFAKTLAKLRPGGVMAFLTSTGTLDKTSPILRQFLTEHGGKIVGAVRMPNGFFSENAGTDVASDLVVVQKVQGRPDNSAFEKGVEYGKTEEWVRRKGRIEKPLAYNGYFQNHPEQVIGTMEVASGQFGPTLKYTMPDGASMLEKVGNAVNNAFNGVDRDALLKSAAVAERQDHTPVYDKEGLRQGNVTMKDGKAFIKSGELLEPIALPNDRKLANEMKRRGRTPSGIMEGLLALRKAMRDVIDAQMSESDTVEADLAPLLANLNAVYDAFVQKNGTLHDKWISPFVLLDKADGNRMLALERVEKFKNEKTGKDESRIVKSDIFTKRVISRGQRAMKADTPKDALVISYSESGAINVPRIAELLGVSGEEAVKKLKEGGDAFENPQTGLLEPSWIYLSGRVRAKLAAARAAVEAGEESFRANVEALEKVQPPMVRLEDAEIKFGATWVDQECMKDFLRDAFGAENMRISLGKNEVTGQWNVEFGRVMNEDPWGETSWSPQEFVSRVLNHGSMNHYETDPIDKKRHLDERKTEANKLAAEKLHSAFSQFIQSSDKWAAPMYERYNAVMTDMVEIKLPNNVLPFRSAGMSEETLGKLFEGGDPNKPKKGREYQSAVIARGVLGGGSLCLAHCVGAGKTLEMQSIGVLGRHLGLFKKPMYVVPNHMLEQFTNEFVEAFPNANILKMSETDVTPANRRAFFAQVANGDWDAIVVKHSTFSKKLAMSDEYQKEFMEAQRKDLIEAIAAMREAGEKISVDQATKKLERLEAKLKKLANAENHDSQIVPFEELGVDQLFVDEAHNFKGMPITTRQGRTGGLSQGDSQRAEDMLMKTQYVQSLHGGDRGVVFATGTPLSNAPVVEAYVMLKYLVPNKLDEQGLKHFDDFVDAFGRITTESEFSTDGKTVKEKDKVSAFVNIPELMKLLRSAVDIVNSDQLDIPRPKPKYHMIDVDMSPAQEQIMEMVAREAAIPPTKEQRNKYLTLTRIAKNACLTPRLLGFEDGGNKIVRAVAEIKRVYDETADNRGAQLVFTDIFNESKKTRDMVDAYMAASDEKTRGVFDSLARRGGKGGAYNLNDEIRDLLVAAGIPKGEIAIVQDIDKSKGDKDANKSALFAKVRSGEVRVLIGSRPKMGEGTNVQERLAAIHLLHPGWKPSEDEQAIGRIIRPGNTYKEGKIFYYLTKGNANIGSYETKNHQLIGVKSKLIDQVMHGDDSRREIDMDESAMDRDMLMGLASGNKALMELIDVKKRAHKLELNTESTLTSARRNKDKAEASGRILERKRGEFAQEQEGVKEWREKNDGRSFALTTPDGRSVEKMKDMAELVSGEMTRLLTKDRYDRAERTVLGDFNGVELVLAFDRYGDEKFKLAVPLLGIEREINYSGFVPDFTTAAMTAFKGRILEAVSPDYAKAYENSLNDMERQAKKMSDDADKLQKDYEGMRGELIKLRARQAQLEREVTPLVVQAVADRSVAAYGNWLIAKPGGGQYVARRESDAKSLSAPTVKELIPLMDAEDFASPRNAATKTADLHLRANAKGETPKVSKIPVADVDFDSPELSPAEQAYVEIEDKTPTEKVMREVYGMTNDEIATALKAAAMEPPKHVRKTDETAWKQAEALLSNPSYMAKLSSAVAKFPRNIADYENNALNVLFRRRQAAVNAAQSVADSRKETLDAINAIPKGERDADYGESLEAARKAYGEAASRLAQAKALMHETGFALTRSSSEAGRRLRSNRGLIDQTDLSYAGISGRMATALGSADKITPEMDAKIREIAGEFASLDEEGRDLATVRLKAHAEKIVEQIKRGDKVRKATERKQGDEAKRVMHNYNDALAQIEVGAAEVGGTLVGLSDQQYPAWGKWLRAIGEFHCFENPDITEEECVRAIVEDISPFMDGVDENQVRDALTGFGHNFRQSRYDAQRLMNDLRSQARLKRQMDWMDETNTMPPLTGMVRDEPSDTTRNLQKQVQERKNEVPDAGRDERRLKGVLESAKTRVKNRIADLERAIETGERIPGRDRTVPEDIELRELKKRRDALQQSYDELFKTERGLTDEQRVKLAERLLGRELEHALEDLDRARSGDFSKRPKRPGVESPSIDALRDRLNDVREQIRELKAAKYEFGMTPEELDAYNARKMANREKALMRLAERIVNGDLRPQKKPQPPMPPEMQKRYDAMGEQMKKARQKLADMRLEAEDATLPSFWRKAGDYLRFVTTAQRALRATMDFSAVLRQSARITLAHPFMGAKAFGKAWNAAHSEANLSVVNDEIMSDPSIQEAVAKYGLHMREVDATSARDVEMFHGMERNKVRIFGKEVSITDIPFFGEFMLKSERHYITYLNAVSAELYSSIVNDRTRFPAGPTAWQKKMVADMINVWNGSAALSKERRQALQKAWVNDILWAPQLAISRIQSAALYDVWHPLVAKGVENAETGAFDAVSAEERKTMFKIGASEHFKSSLAMIALGALLKWLFADEDDWYDFGQADWFEKLLMLASPKVGNTTIDLTGGEQSVNRAAHKIWKLATSGKVRTGSGRMAEMGSYGGPTVWGVIGRYVQGKTSPWLSELVSLMEGRDYVGNEYTWKDAAIGAAVPLTFEDVKEQLEQNGIGKSLITIPLSLLGAGGSTYDRKPYENMVNRFLEAEKQYHGYEVDDLLDENARQVILADLRSSNPLLADDVRGTLIVHSRGGNTGLIPDAQRAERELKKLQSDQSASPSDLEEAERLYRETHDAVMKYIRANR